MIKNQAKENTSKNTHAKVAELLIESLLDSTSSKESPKILQGRKILDIPCGEGAFMNRIVPLGGQVYACDIENLLYQQNGADFRIGNMNEKLPYEDNFFDALVCIDGIEHIERQFDFVREAQRILKKKGSLIISTPNISSARSRWRYFLTGHHNKCKAPLDERKVTPLHHKCMISFPELRYILHTNGFKIHTVTTNRRKPVSYLYLLYWPIMRWITPAAYKKENPQGDMKGIYRDVLEVMFSLDIFCGETLIVQAYKQ